ncbi:MAG: DUF481 domain-containing protein [Steroidobacteraceae bacterium]
MLKRSLAAVGAALLLHAVPQAAYAQAACSCATKAPAAPAGTWAAQGQLGLIVTSADTTTKSGNASFNAAHEMGRWTLSGGFAGLYASSGGYTTQQDLNANVQADFALSKRTFWFSSARWDRNLFSGFAYQESVATGAGYSLVQTPATQLIGELGVGYRRELPELLTLGPVGNVTARGCSAGASGTITCAPQAVENDAVLQAGVNYAHSFTQSTKLTNALLVQYGASDTTTTDNLSLQVKVDASFTLAVGMQLVNNTSPPPGNVRHTDTVMTVNLVYALANPKLSATATAPALTSNLNLSNLP